MAYDPPAGQNCGNCVYCILNDRLQILECHRGPPSIMDRRSYPQHFTPNQSELGAHVWATVGPTDWCGHWSDVPQPATPGSLPAISRVVDNPAPTTSTTEVMMGLGNVFTVTPVNTGRVAAIVGGTCANSGANGGLNITGRYGTGTPPANGVAAAAYATWSITQQYFMTSAKDVSGFTVVGGFTGLVDGAAVWFDLSIAATGGGTASITNTQCLIWEL